jgi:hypothetical protein
LQPGQTPTTAQKAKAITVEFPDDPVEAIKAGAQELGVDPLDLATAIGYETAGSFDPWQAGPTTKWGQHRGLIQWGQPQAEAYGVTPDMPFGHQVKAATRYLKDRGVQPGMGLPDIYSAINAGTVGMYNASDRPGETVSTHVARMEQDYRPIAASFLGVDLEQPQAPMQEPGGLPEGFVVDNAMPEGFAPDAAPEPATEAPIQADATGMPEAPVEGEMAPGDASMPELLRSVIGQGMMFAMGDETEAAARALYAKSTGDERSYDEIYTEELNNVRQGIEAFNEREPGLATAAEISGGLIPAVVSRGKAVPQTVGQAAKRTGLVGAGYGGLYGFGSGEGEEDRITQSIIGMATGGATGAVTPIVMEGARRLARPLMNFLRSAGNPEREASRRVAAAIETDASRGGQALTEPQVTQAQRVGQPVTNIERGGETTRALSRSAANTSPQARDTLNEVIDARFETQGDRITDFVKTMVGGRAANETREDLLQAARKANRPAYAQAYAAGARPLQSPELARLAESDDVQKAMRAAEKTARSRAVADGLKVPGDGKIQNLQYWDYVKRELDDAAGAAIRQGRNEEGSRLTAQARLLREDLDRMVPQFKQAREGAASFFQANDALEAGQNFLRPSIDRGEAAKALSKMSAPERKLFAEGFTDSLIRQIEKTGDRRNVVNRIYQSKDARERIRIALGPEKAKNLEAFLRAESAMDLVRSAVQGNSTTARQLVELGLAGGAGGASTLITGDPFDPRNYMVALLAGAGARGRSLIDARVARKVAEKLASDNPQVFQEGVEMIAKSTNLLKAFRDIGAIASVPASQAASGAAAESPQEPR